MTRAGVISSVLFTALLAAAPALRGDDWVSSVRKNVEEDSSGSSSSPPPPPPGPSSNGWGFRWGSDCDDEDEEAETFSELFGKLAFIALAAPYWGPHMALQDDFSRPAEFAPFPYADDRAGRIVTQFDDRPTQSFSARLTTEVGSNLGDTESWGGRLQLDTAFRLGLDSEFFSRTESRSGGQQTISTGDINLIYRFAQSERVEFYSGIGMNYLVDSGGKDALGFNFTYGADFYPVKPIVISSSIDLGRLGGASLIHGRATIGLIWKRVEVYTGYDVYSVGSADLHSWITGLRFYF